MGWGLIIVTSFCIAAVADHVVEHYVRPRFTRWLERKFPSSAARCVDDAAAATLHSPAQGSGGSYSEARQ